MSSANVKGVVREKYGEAALRLQSGATGDCCGVAGSEACDPIASNIYSAAQERELPDRAIKASLGCGNPAALADLNPGETVLDRLGLTISQGIVLAPEAASTCCFPLVASGQQEKPTVSR
jgi:hypothetical protein